MNAKTYTKEQIVAACLKHIGTCLTESIVLELENANDDTSYPINDSFSEEES